MGGSGMKKRKSQVENVLEYLQEHGSITYQEAFDNFRVASLKAVIWKLRKQGHVIQAMDQILKGGKKRTEYYLLSGVQKDPITGKPYTQAERVLEVLKKDGNITSRYMRDCMLIKKPSSVIQKLIHEKGCHIKTHIVSDATGVRFAEWILETRRPPELFILPWKTVTSFWKWRR